MSLASRLLLSFGLVALLAAGLIGWSVRESTRQRVEEDFHARIDAAAHGTQVALSREIDLLRRQLNRLCKHGTFVDQATLELERTGGDVAALDPGRRIAFRHHVEDEANARDLDDLVLLTRDGTVLGATDLEQYGTQDRRLAELMTQESSPRLRPAAENEARWIEVHCTHETNGFMVGLVGGVRISEMLERVGDTNGVTLRALSAEDRLPESDGSQVVRSIELDDATDIQVVATISKAPLKKALRELDREILLSGAIALLIAVIMAVWLARSLSRPISALARETREVLSGEPRPVKAGGGKEIGQLAEAFNQTLDELAAMRNRLAATERIAARREVARQVAHEIKNPLAPIRAAVETLRRLRARDDPAFDEYFDEATTTVLEEVHRITNIVTEFTNFARLPAPHPASMDLVAVARGVVGLHDLNPEATARRSSSARVELVSEEIGEILADRDQMVQVLTNLVQNGLDAASAVRKDARVLVAVEKKSAEKVRVVVRDNGPGVSDDMVPRLFEPYATTKEHGTGLGLAIVQRIVFEHGGAITYRPATKGGAVFEITLPIRGPSLLEKPLTDTGKPSSRRRANPAPPETVDPDSPP